MNYRHAYHAGNFADVLKHIVLVEAIAYLQRKPAAIRVIDTHAGTGLYDLAGEEAEKTGEWRSGYGRLIAGRAALEGPARDLTAGYLDMVAAAVTAGRGGDKPEAGETRGRAYPGSPLIAAGMLRPQDRLIANELHPADRATLGDVLAPFPNAKVMGLDGYVALKSLLPPPERRGVVLVDPPFEIAGEFDRMAEGLRQGLKRFATGVFAFWYPIKDPKPVDRFASSLDAPCAGGVLRVELMLRTPRDPDRLNGCGLVVANPPFSMPERLRAGLPAIARLLSTEGGAAARVDWAQAPRN